MHENDPLGLAINDYYNTGDDNPVTVISESAGEDVLFPGYFFRLYDEMPKLEKAAMNMCKGKVLDIGAGAGCHSKYLQSVDMDVTALEKSPLCCEVMKKSGIDKVVQSDIYQYSGKKYDTILLLMNGVGIAGSVRGLEALLVKLKSLLNKDGKILLDSSDLIYLYQQEDGSILFDINAENYYGEIEYIMRYNGVESDTFSWLFIDQVLLSEVAEKCGYKTRIAEYGSHYDFLAELEIG